MSEPEVKKIDPLNMMVMDEQAEKKLTRIIENVVVNIQKRD